MNVSRELRASAVTDGGLLMLDLGAPTSGNRWDLRRLVVVDAANPATAHASTVFVSTPHGNPAQIDVGQIDDLSTGGLPAAFRWSDETVVLQADDHVQAFVSGLGSGLTIVANAQVEETPSW